MLPEKHSELWWKAEVKQDVPNLWTLSDPSGIFIFLMGCFYFTCPPFPHLLCSRLYPCVAAEACVRDSTNPCHTCPHSLFWRGSNTISLWLGILADKNVLCAIRPDRPCEHVSPWVAYPEKPAEPKTEQLLSANGFCLPLGKDLHDPAVSLTSLNCAYIRETKHRDFSLEVQLDSNYSVGMFILHILEWEIYRFSISEQDLRTCDLLNEVGLSTILI